MPVSSMNLRTSLPPALLREPAHISRALSRARLSSLCVSLRPAPLSDWYSDTHLSACASALSSPLLSTHASLSIAHPSKPLSPAMRPLGQPESLLVMWLCISNRSSQASLHIDVVLLQQVNLQHFDDPAGRAARLYLSQQRQAGESQGASARVATRLSFWSLWTKVALLKKWGQTQTRFFGIVLLRQVEAC